MRALNAAAITHIAQTCTTLAACWRIERRDGVQILGTEHDKDITASVSTADVIETGGTYFSAAGITGSDIRYASDTSVANSEVQGSYNRPLTVVDLRAADIDAGLFDRARVVIFLLDYTDPDDFRIILNSGTLGDITRFKEGMYTTEIRGLAERLKQNFIRTYGVKCDAFFGDRRCKVDLDPLRLTGAVTGVATRRVFDAAGMGLGSTGPLAFGTVRFTSGNNESFSMDIKSHVGDTIELMLNMPRNIQVGDGIIVTPGCDKAHLTCKITYGNILNNRAHGFYAPGPDEVLKFGGQQRVA